MQPITTIKSQSMEITLYASSESFEAKVKKESTIEMHFTAKQIKCGVLGDKPHQALLAKIDSLRAGKIAAFVFPKENPTELWVFEAARLVGPSVLAGKEELRLAGAEEVIKKDESRKEKLQRQYYKRALNHFNRALGLQRREGGETQQELERIVKDTEKKRAYLKYKKNAPLYLPNQGEIDEFRNIVNLYWDDEDDIYTCFQDLIPSDEPLLPRHYWMLALIHEKKGEWLDAMQAYLKLSEDNPHALICIERACMMLDRALPANSQLNDRKDAMRMTFEQYVANLTSSSSSSSAPLPRPTCFICFNVEEADVRAWLDNTLAPDLERAGLDLKFCSWHLDIGTDLSTFQELARKTDLAIVICTPAVKAKCESRVDAPTGVAQEIRLIKERYNDRDKANSIFPIVLKGTREESIPAPYFEPIFSSRFFTDKRYEFQYFLHAFELFAGMRRRSRKEGQKIAANFANAIKPILQGNFDENEVIRWREQKQASSVARSQQT